MSFFERDLLSLTRHSSPQSRCGPQLSFLSFLVGVLEVDTPSIWKKALQ